MAKRTKNDNPDGIQVGGIDLTEENYLSLRRAYRKSRDKEEEEFTFQGKTMVTSYAKFVLEEMETHAIIKPLIEEEEEDDEP